MATKPDISNDLSASLTATQIVRFEQQDWTSFRTVEGLQQKAGVAANKLIRLVLKELTDNGLDNPGAIVSVGHTKGVYAVEDDGPGLDGTPEEIAHLFSISRPKMTTKLWRLPTRGALGNGLRVVAGAVLASAGSLAVTTRGRRIVLRPDRDGTTKVVTVTPSATKTGTKIEIGFGPAIPHDDDALNWSNIAIDMAHGQTYSGKSSPWWYDAAQFHELLSASGKRPVRELILNLEGCTRCASEIVADAKVGRKLCADINRKQSDMLLTVARDFARDVSPARLGGVGFNTTATGEVSFGLEPLKAQIPFVVEAWAEECESTSILVCVNRTPVTGSIRAARDKREINLFGCGLHHTVAEAPKDKNFAIVLNVTTPYMPITSDGKEPDLEPFFDTISDAVAKAVRKARRPNARGMTQKDVVLEHLDEVIAEVSGEEGYRFNARQLFYALRPIVMEETGAELKIGNFTAILTDYEQEYGDIPLMYREPRGSITHPHRDETITLGTLMVEEYERPSWTFNKLLYIEKEGALEALKQNRWGARHDCAIMSSKGFSTRAARDLIDKLVEHDEPVEVFCVHDADASGSMIFQTLQEETKARGARKIKIVNLGLEPWEADAMGLEVEDLEDAKRQKPVADYIHDKDRETGADWADWLQTKRVELNAMTTPDFIAWLDNKMAEFGDGKLIPPEEVLEDELAERIERKVRNDITERILREADIDGQVAAAIAAIEPPDGAQLAKDIAKMFEDEPELEWRDHIETVADSQS